MIATAVLEADASVRARDHTPFLHEPTLGSDPALRALLPSTKRLRRPLRRRRRDEGDPATDELPGRDHPRVLLESPPGGWPISMRSWRSPGARSPYRRCSAASDSSAG